METFTVRTQYGLPVRETTAVVLPGACKRVSNARLARHDHGATNGNGADDVRNQY